MRPKLLRKNGLGGSLETTPSVSDEQHDPNAYLLGTIDFEASTVDNAASQRYGKKAYNPVEIPGIGPILSLFKHYRKGALEYVMASRNQVAGGQAIFKDANDGAFSSFITGFAQSTKIEYQVFSIVDEETCYISNGTVFKKTNGTTVWTWGNTPPATALTLAPGAAGSPNGEYHAKVRYGYGPVADAIWGWSNFSAETSVTVVNQKIVVSNIPVGAAGSGVVWRQIAITAANDFSYFYVLDTIQDNTTTTKTYDFAANDSLQFAEISVDDEHNELPPTGGKYWCSYGDRLWCADNKFFYYSKLLKPDSWNLLGTAPGIIRDAQREDGAYPRGLLPFEEELLLLTETKTYRLGGRAAPYSLIKVADVGCIAPYTVTRIGHHGYWLSKHGPVHYDGNGVYPVKRSERLKAYWEGVLSVIGHQDCAHAVHYAEFNWWMLFMATNLRPVAEFQAPVGGGALVGTTISEPYRLSGIARSARVLLPNICLVFDYVLGRWYAFSWQQACSYAFDGGNDTGDICAGENATGFVSHLYNRTVATDLGVTVAPVLRLRRESLSAPERRKRLRRLFLTAHQEKINPSDPNVTLEARVSLDNSNVYDDPQTIPMTDTSRTSNVWFSTRAQGKKIQLEFRHAAPTRAVLETLGEEFNVRGTN